MTTIEERYEVLTGEEQSTIIICSVLCTTDGIITRHFCEVIGIDPHAFRKILKSGLLEEFLGVCCFREKVYSFLSDSIIPHDLLNSVLAKLLEKSTLSITDDLLRCRDYFTMAMNILKYVLAHQDGVAFEVFASLLVNIVKNYEVYAKPEVIQHNKELPIMKAIILAKEKIDSHSLLYASLLTCEASFYLQGFWYDQSRDLLEQAIAIESQFENASVQQAYTFLVYAFWFENFGRLADCVAMAYKAWDTTKDPSLKKYAAIIIAYQLALLSDFDSCDMWLNRLDIEQLPKFSIVRVYNNMILALKYSNNESLAEDLLIRAEWLIDEVNSSAPIKARLYYVWSQLYGSKWGLLREANTCYNKYTVFLAQHFATTDGAMYISIAAEVERLTSIGATTAAKHIIHEQLDSMPLTHPSYAISVGQDVCLAYTEYYRTTGVPLAQTYCTIGLDYAKKAIPSDETLSVLCQAFGGNVPSSLSGEDGLWGWEVQALLNMFAGNVASSEIKQKINQLIDRFPAKRTQLDVMNASLMDTQIAVSEWQKCIVSESNKRYDTAVLCAQYAAAQGLIFEGELFFELAFGLEDYHKLNKYKKIAITLERTINLEKCGYRAKAEKLWQFLERLATETSLLANVYQAHANCKYDCQKYREAIELYDKCIAVYVPEDSLIDERMSSILAYQSSCYSALGEYQTALLCIIEAQKYYPIEDNEAFNLLYNNCYLLVALKKYQKARELLAKVERIARSDSDRESISELKLILALKPEQRDTYFKHNS